MSKGKRYEEPKLNMKKVFAVIIAIIVVIMCVVMLQGILKKDEKQGKVTSKDYFAAYHNNKWGVIDSNGDTVIDPSYAEMIIVPNSKSDVFLCTYDVDYTNNTYKTKALNSKNQEILTGYDQIEAISNTDANNNLWYEGDVLKVKKAEKYGLIDFSGKELLPCEYEKIEALEGIENAFKILKDGQYGIADDKGRIVIPTKYKNIDSIEKENTQKYIIQNTENKYGVVDSTNKTIVEPKYEAISKIYNDNYYVVTENGKQIVIKQDGTQVLNGNYDKIVTILKNPEDGIIYKSKDKYGIMKLSGEVVINPDYENIKETKKGNFIVKKDGKYGIIDTSRNIKKEIKYQSLLYNEKADIYIAEDDEYKNEILNSDFETKLLGYLIELNETKGYIELRKDDEYKYYNFKLEEQKPSNIFNSNTLFASKKDGKYGFVDKDGKVVVDYIYDDVTNQNAFGFAGIKKDGKWGTVNKDGKVIQEPIYDLEENLKIDFIGNWYLGKDLNMNYYRK